MGRKSKHSKNDKIKACEEYKRGEGSFESIAKSLGVTHKTIRIWYYSYLENGSETFNSSSRNKAYTKEFKLDIVKSYLSGKYSSMDIHVIYKISEGVLRKWLEKYYNGIELKDYDPKGDVYTMKSRKTTFEERLEIVKWVIANDMSYKEAANKFANSYANVYKWTKAYISAGSDDLKDKKRGPKHKSFVDEDSLSEIDKLKLELERERALRKRREFELEVLKKKEEFENQNHFQK